MRSVASRGATLACALLASCASIDTGSVAHRRASEFLDCASERVEISAIGEYRYRGVGCGRSVVLACTAGQLEPLCLRERSAGGERTPPAARSVSGERTPPAARTDAGPSSVEAQVRAGLDARRADVLACVGRDRVAVRVAYADDGSIELTLQGAGHGTPEERCVQDALDGVRVAATGESGVIVHLVD